jgi:acetoin utilization deacetylase AcuC-like enzyme
MTCALFTHPASLRHVTPDGHPERIARIESIERALADPVFAGLDRRTCPEADDATLRLCHPQAYIDHLIAALPASGEVALDADTWMSPDSLTAARAAVGGACAAVDAVLSGDIRSAFVACRPPGHHAETQKPMGFCLFGTAAIAAKHALDRHGLSRVAVVDFDVHHGNGTQDLLWDETRVRFVSSHQMPRWPGAGHPAERGAHDQVFNLPLDPGTGGRVFRETYEDAVFPMLQDFAPELIVISAGFDAHAADPLANLALVEEDFAWVTGRLCDIAEGTAEGRVVSTLEGGYDLEALAASVVAHVTVLEERSR